MLFKKTLKVAAATALWMVALLGANSAMAQDELPTYSAESLAGAGPAFTIEFNQVTGDPNADPPVASNQLQATVMAGDRAAYYIDQASSTEMVHIRVTGTGVLRLPHAPAVTIGVQDGTTTNYAASGVTVGTATAVAGTAGTGWRYSVDTGGAATAHVVQTIRVNIGDSTTTDATHDAIVTGMGTGGVMISVYANQADAHFGEGTPYLAANMDLLAVKSSVIARGADDNPVTNTATAASRFTTISGKELATDSYEISVGGFEVFVNGAHLDASDGMSLMSNVVATDATTSLYAQTGVHGGTRFYGDGGWDFAEGFRFDASSDCTGGGPGGAEAGAVEGDGAGIVSSPVSEEDATTDVMGGIAPDDWYLCVSISNENDTEIPAGAYSVDVNLSRAVGNAQHFLPKGKAGIPAGEIKHDGTTVRIPFVTSYDGYTQRIVMVNRNKVAVAYAITFLVEGDGEIMGDNPHEGMLPADQATVVKVADLVTLSDPTRAAATLTVAARSGTIDVATTMVNKMDQSTDTVVLTSN